MMGQYYGYIVALASAMGGFLFGYEIGIIDQILTMEGFGLLFGTFEYGANGTVVETAEGRDIDGWITFTFLIGCVIGAAVSWMLLDSIGRKYSIFIGSIFFMTGGAMQTGASHIATLYVGRIVSGFGVGLMSAAVPLYISETARTDVRGRLISIYQLMVTIGIFIASCVNAIILSTLRGDAEWRLAMGMQMVPAFIFWVLMIFLPYSPRWLIDKNRDKEAVVILAKLRNQPESSGSVQEEMRAIRAEVEAERLFGNVSWLELAKRGIRNRLAIGVILQFFQQWTGINVVMYYAAKLFEAMGFSRASSSVTFVIITAAVNVLATFPGMWLVERIGRKKLMIIGGFIMGFAHYGICLFVGLIPKEPLLAYPAMVCVYLFTIAFAATWGPVVWVYQSEIFPLRVRAKGIALCTMSNWIWNAIIAKITPLFLRDITFYTYLIFGSMGILMAIFAIIFVPETKGRSLEHMDAVFGSPDLDEQKSEADKRARHLARGVELASFDMKPISGEERFKST